MKSRLLPFGLLSITLFSGNTFADALPSENQDFLWAMNLVSAYCQTPQGVSYMTDTDWCPVWHQFVWPETPTSELSTLGGFMPVIIEAAHLISAYCHQPQTLQYPGRLMDTEWCPLWHQYVWPPVYETP